jgi:hypothetical protein
MSVVAQLLLDRSGDSHCEEISMPYSLIPVALGVCFCLVWAIIGEMIFRDGQFVAQQERDTEGGIIALPRAMRQRGAA